jgi:hypothetical protein
LCRTLAKFPACRRLFSRRSHSSQQLSSEKCLCGAASFRPLHHSGLTQVLRKALKAQRIGRPKPNHALRWRNPNCACNSFRATQLTNVRIKRISSLGAVAVLRIHFPRAGALGGAGFVGSLQSQRGQDLLHKRRNLRELREISAFAWSSFGVMYLDIRPVLDFGRAVGYVWGAYDCCHGPS